MTTRAIAEFVAYLNSLDIQIVLENGEQDSPDVRLRCNAPQGRITPELRQELSDRKPELISYLWPDRVEGKPQRAADRGTTEGKKADISSLSLHSHAPLSFAQQRLWFLYQLAPTNPFYNVPAAIRLTGSLDHAALERAFNKIVRRHAALRTQFTTLAGKPVQLVNPHATVEIAVVNLRSVPVTERPRISHQLATTEAQRPFNLTTDALLRLTLLQFDPTESVLLLTLHHIVADGWSLGVLIRELAECYTAFVEGRSPTLPLLPIQYTDFARWQRTWLQGEVLEKQLAYWRKQLANLSVLELPSDRPRPAVQTYRGATLPLQLSPALTQALEALSQKAGGSLFMTLLAAFQTLLYRYTGQADLAIGSPIANRHRSDVEGLIGFFVNSLVLRVNLSGNPTFLEVLEQVRNVALEAYDHQDLPFEKLVEELDPDRDLSRNPLFQVAFALQNAPMQVLELPGLTLAPTPLESGSTRFDLEVHLWEANHGLQSLWQSQSGLSGFISYSTDLFDRHRIERLVGHFQTLLAEIVENPNARLSELPLLTEAETQQIVVEWNRAPLVPPRQKWKNLISGGNTHRESTSDLCFHQIVEKQVEQTPGAIALVSEQGSLTYAELDQQANQLAQTLQQMGVQPNSLVGLCVDRSADMVIGILGILKAGGAYVPLDPSYPSDRLHWMLTDTQIPVLLTQSWLVQLLPAITAQILCLDQLQLSNSISVPAGIPGKLNGSSNPLDSGSKESKVTSNRLAYVIYTSGSTGIPKGVLLSHQGLCNVVEAQRQIFHPSRNSRVLQFSSLSFDASMFELALAFGSGAALYIPPKAAQLPGLELTQFLRDNAITHALLTPAVLAVLPSANLPDLQVLITGGEVCSSHVIDRWAVNRHFFNAYGPTETTIWATVAKLHPGDNPLMIGRPILNTQVYLLDANLNPVPIGIPGELYIGGIGLAHGYLNRPELTAERFIHCSTAVLPGSRLYKTGDRAQYHADGRIEFLGRVDHQIKIRGFRVELGEVEAALQRHPAIQDAVVVTAGDKSHEMQLIAYFSLNHPYLQHNLQFLQQQHLQQWQTLYDQTYQGEGKQGKDSQTLKGRIQEGDGSEKVEEKRFAPQFNITGWNSSYTGAPIPLEAMREWVSDRVRQILTLKPQRVLEIGCGTGLLLFQLAPHCQQYVGTDFSEVSLASVQTQLDALKLSHVQLLHRIATDFEGIDLASFDVVILNSIAQYFPSADYLMQVLAKAVAAVASGGTLFVGDVRSLPLLTAFHSWMKFTQADANMERTQLWHQVERSRFEEPELAIDPAFFQTLRNQFPQIQQVQIRLSRGRSENEMTQFRYNVLLSIQEPLPEHHPVRPNCAETTTDWQDKHHFYNWQVEPMTVKAVEQVLTETEPETLAIANIANRRINQAVKVANWLQKQTSPKTVGQMRDNLQDAEELAIAPQDWWDLEITLPYSVEISWSEDSQTGNYDVLLIHRDSEIKFNQSRLDPPADEEYTNYPLQSTFVRQLIPELRQSLKQTLPDYMTPAAFVALAALPLNHSGKVDRRALPSVHENTSQNSPSTTEPTNSTESTLVDIWKELLQLKSVSIHSNFFELGGHSLLATQMTSRVRDTFGLELPLKRVFEAPTIAQLAPIIETLRSTNENPVIPPIVRLDRAAFRRKQLILPNGKSEIQTASATLPKDHAFLASVSATRSPLIPLTLGDNRQPFFCVHPLFGVVFPYLELAHQLDSDRSFYGLQPLGLDGTSAPLKSIKAIANYYIQAIQTMQPRGPYLLGGWSFGGLVAFEMAQQLTQVGQPVELLAILDTPAPNQKLSFSQSLKFLLGTSLWSTLPFLADYLSLAAQRFPGWNTWFSRQQKSATSTKAFQAIARLLPEESRLSLLDESVIRSLLPIVYANSQAAYRYMPQPYAGCVTLFKAAEQPDALQHEPTLGWGTVANQIQLHEVPGNHLSLLKQPHVQTLARHLQSYL